MDFTLHFAILVMEKKMDVMQKNKIERFLYFTKSALFDCKSCLSEGHKLSQQKLRLLFQDKISQISLASTICSSLGEWTVTPNDSDVTWRCDGHF